MTVQMVTPDIDKLTVSELRRERGWSADRLAKLAEVSKTSVCRVEDKRTPYCTRTDVALRIADAFGLGLHEIRWHHAFSDVGRPVGSGSPLRLVTSSPEERMCPVHNFALPATGVCDDCS